MDAASPLVLSHPMRVALLGGELVANRLRARPGCADPSHRPHPARHVRRTPRSRHRRQPADRAGDALPAGRVPRPGRQRRAQLPRTSRELRGLSFRAFHELDGTAVDPESECARHQALLDQAPIGLVVLGLGRDGHVAFDEPVRASRRERAGFDSTKSHAQTPPRLRRSREGPPRSADGGAPNACRGKELLMLVSGARRLRR